ncbi:D-alanyl carrier protein:peptidoglycan D-alanyltransferase [Arcobacter acticola]|uniref:D-alanyl carrier protein:peptidoglycan D-alanyltransferase n=1 Tax=Arcobacter acticola TaxID=1849015 RepID=A0A6M8EVH9_9BACT|nr:D-alanyl-lipoteichoic acid biosynthesis protein DltD [Arcobacter acticola]QKE28565.1 D-alanyl carrier protein:peptidoglycan D-alanyltransferase [Arcobacter acticola]
MNKLFINILSFTIALLLVLGLLYFNKNKILNYYAKPLQDSLQRTISLQNDLESGKIVLFGSSELVFYPNQKFLPQNYFNNDLKLPLRVQGNEGQQSFAIMSQLAACDNELVRDNAKVVVLLSPSWFTGSYDNGLKMPKFLEYMYPGMMNKLYFQSESDDKYKLLISDYIKKNIAQIKEPNFIYKDSFYDLKSDYLDNKFKQIIIENFDSKDNNPKNIDYKNPNLDYESLKLEAKSITIPPKNNNYGINDEYYDRYIVKQIKKDNFPFGVIVSPDINQNQEYNDFLVLLEYLETYKIKALFVMQDLNPYAFANNREEANKLMQIIKSKVLEHNFEYLDMWSNKKEDYEIGTLTDIVHMGELGWVRINQAIINHFMKNKEN